MMKTLRVEQEERGASGGKGADSSFDRRRRLQAAARALKQHLRRGT